MDVDQKEDRSQKERFIETARRSGCEEDEAAFKAKLAVIARQKPKDAKLSIGSTPHVRKSK